MWLIVPLLSFLASVTAQTSVSRSDQQAIVDLHNQFRRNVQPPAADMERMVWDDELAKKMEEYINTCPMNHDSNDARKIEGWGMNIGQNLAWGYSDWNAVVTRWHEEVANFGYGYGSINSRVVGHYTQVVQNRAARIGCAYKYCPGTQYRNYYGCNYAYGQMNWDTPYTSGSTCSACRSRCYNKLCDCGGKICKNGGTLDLNTCRCSCAGNYDGDDCGQMNCPSQDPPQCGSSWGFNPSHCSIYYNVPQECPRMCGVC